jgi:hypothetical protein
MTDPDVCYICHEESNLIKCGCLCKNLFVHVICFNNYKNFNKHKALTCPQCGKLFTAPELIPPLIIRSSSKAFITIEILSSNNIPTYREIIEWGMQLDRRYDPQIAYDYVRMVRRYHMAPQSNEQEILQVKNQVLTFYMQEIGYSTRQIEERLQTALARVAAPEERLANTTSLAIPEERLQTALARVAAQQSVPVPNSHQRRQDIKEFLKYALWHFIIFSIIEGCLLAGIFAYQNKMNNFESGFSKGDCVIDNIYYENKRDDIFISTKVYGYYNTNTFYDFTDQFNFACKEPECIKRLEFKCFIGNKVYNERIYDSKNPRGVFNIFLGFAVWFGIIWYGVFLGICCCICCEKDE